MRNVYWGISTSILQDKYDWEPLLAFKPEVIEFYNYKSKDVPNIHNFCNRNSIIPALHVPTPYNGEKLEKFCPTGRDIEAKKLAISLTQRTIKCAHELQALHVVVHFPAPYTPHHRITQDEIKYFFNPVLECAEKYNVCVLVENLSAHRFFQSPEDYLNVISQYDNLGFCLDVGHAHLLYPNYSNQDFISILKNYIYSVHFYNTNFQGERRGRHCVVNSQLIVEEGWIDIRKLTRQLYNETSTKAIILEYDQISNECMLEVADNWAKIKASYVYD